jgi:hypothetical protein
MNDSGDLMNLESCSLADLGNIQYEFAKGSLPTTGHALLVVRLAGSVSNQPENADGFGLASAIIMAGLEAWQPWAAVLDLQRLKYEWGDEMQNVLSAPRRWYAAVYPFRAALTGEKLPKEYPLAVVISDGNRAGLSSLAREEPGVDPSLILCESISDAVAALDLRLADVPLM